MSTQVSRNKYENLKLTAGKWRDECEKLKLIIQDMETHINNLEEKINNLYQENESLKNKIKTHTLDTKLLEELENENKAFRKLTRSLKREKKEILEKNHTTLYKFKTDIILRDAKIESLEEGKKAMRERYNELKEDYREERRNNKKTVQE